MVSALPRGTTKEVFTSPSLAGDVSKEMSGAGTAWKAVGEIGAQLHQVGIEIAKPELQARGAADVQRDENGQATFVPRTPLNELDQAYNLGGFQGLAAQTDTDQRTHLNELAITHRADPEKFGTAAEAYVTAQAKAAPMQLKAEILASGRALAAQYSGRLADQKRARDTAKDDAALDAGAKSEFYDTLLPLVRQGGTDTPEAVASWNKVQNFLTGRANPIYNHAPEELAAQRQDMEAQMRAEAALGAALKTYDKHGRDAALKQGDATFYNPSLHITPDTADRYSGKLRGMIDRKEADKRDAQQASAQYVQSRLANAEAMAGAGQDWERGITRREIRGMLGDGAQPVIDALDYSADVASNLNWLKTATPAEIAARRAALDPVRLDLEGKETGARAYGFAADKRRADAFNDALAARDKALADDPAAYVVSSMPYLQQLAAAAPQQGATGWANFVTASLNEQARLGVPANKRRILTTGQADSIVSDLSAASPDQAVMRMRSLTAGLLPDHLAILSRQIAPKSRALGIAVSLSADHPGIASDIVIGDRFLANNPDAHPPVGKAGAALDKLTAGTSGWWGASGGLFQYAPDARGGALAAATALYARQQIGGKATTFTPDKMEESIAGVLGGKPFDFRGQKIIGPTPEANASTMRDLMGKVNDQTIRQLGNGQPVDATGKPISAAAISKYGVLTYTGESGVYRVMFPGQGHVAVKGNPNARTFMLNLGALSGTPAPRDLPPPPPEAPQVTPAKIKTTRMPGGRVFKDAR